MNFLGDVALAAASGKLDVARVTFWIRRIFEDKVSPDGDI